MPGIEGPRGRKPRRKRCPYTEGNTGCKLGTTVRSSHERNSSWWMGS
jgi:hypothetical protein